MLIVPLMMVQPPSLVISGSECLFLFSVDLPSLQSMTMKGENFKYFSKIVIRSMDSRVLCSVDVKKLKSIHAKGSGYFSNVVNYVIEGLDE